MVKYCVQAITLDGISIIGNSSFFIIPKSITTYIKKSKFVIQKLKMSLTSIIPRGPIIGGRFIGYLGFICGPPGPIGPGPIGPGPPGRPPLGIGPFGPETSKE